MAKNTVKKKEPERINPLEAVLILPDNIQKVDLIEFWKLMATNFTSPIKANEEEKNQPKNEIEQIQKRMIEIACYAYLEYQKFTKLKEKIKTINEEIKEKENELTL